jgi:hypothetical protein
MADHYDALTEAERAKIAVDENGCWLWLGYVAPTGYAMVSPSVARLWSGSRYAHRVYYTRFVGPIPEGLEIDHLCRVKRCCNPDHLEAVTRSVNILRGPQPELTRERHARHRARGRCRHGHDLMDPRNVYYYGDGRWQCDICRRERYIPAAKARARGR